MKLSDIDLDLRLPKPPLILVAVMVTGAFVPMFVASAIWFKRNYFDPNPRVHIFQDMDNQAKAKAQSASGIFKDGRSMRAYVPGTVAWGRDIRSPDPTMLKDDDLAYRGRATDPETGELVTIEDDNGEAQLQYLPGFPETVEVDYDFVKRGQQQYMIHCYTCHGADGKGLGPTKLAMDVWATHDTNAPADRKSGTVPLVPANLVSEVDADTKQEISTTRFNSDVYANGKMFNTITNGQGTMNALGPMIKIKDRWAIVAYIRAMQASTETALAAGAAE